MGLGNLLNRDEGLGVQALKRLDARLGEQPEVELLDGGVLGLNLLGDGLRDVLDPRLQRR